MYLLLCYRIIIEEQDLKEFLTARPRRFWNSGEIVLFFPFFFFHSNLIIFFNIVFFYLIIFSSHSFHAFLGHYNAIRYGNIILSQTWRNMLQLFRKPLVCTDLCPYPHAHCTHFCSVQRTHSHPSFWARTLTRTRTTFFLNKIQKKIS